MYRWSRSFSSLFNWRITYSRNFIRSKYYDRDRRDMSDLIKSFAVHLREEGNNRETVKSRWPAKKSGSRTGFWRRSLSRGRDRLSERHWSFSMVHTVERKLYQSSWEHQVKNFSAKQHFINKPTSIETKSHPSIHIGSFECSIPFSCLIQSTAFFHSRLIP